MKTSRRRTMLVPLAAIVTSLALASAAAAAVPGDLDKSFSGDGHLVTDFSGNSVQVLDSVVDANGKLVIAGAEGPEIGVFRFNPDGSFDPAFGGGDGEIVIDSGATNGGEKAVAVSIDAATGNILVLGEAFNSPNTDIVVARVLPSGTLDNTFDGPSGNGNGRFRLDSNQTESGVDIIAAGDKVVFTQTVGAGSTRVARIAQLTSTGAYDTAGFGSPNGYFDWQWAANTDSFPNGLARDSDGKFIVSGFINGTGPYGVTRINTNGSMDTSFNPGGTIPGIARPSLPAGYIDGVVLDVVVDSNGITVAGNIQKGSPTFDTEAMLSRVSTSGTLVTAFGNTNGYAILPLVNGNSESFTGISSLDGRLFAGGTAGPSSHFVQLGALYTSAGVLDTANFASPNGYLTTDTGISSTGTASGVSQSGVAYLVGQGAGNPTKIAASAVCLFMPPACPSPDMPVVESVSPSNGSNENNPLVKGTVPAGDVAPLAVNIYRDAACAGPVAGSGTEASFEGAGIPASVPDNSSTTFYAKAIGANGDSACSSTSVSYTEVSPPAAQAPAPAAKKKCKKKKAAGAKKKKCKKKRK